MSPTNSSLEARVKKIEDLLWPDGPSGPTIFQKIQKRLDALEQAGDGPGDRYVTHEEFDRYRRIVAELQAEVGRLRGGGLMTTN